MQHSALQIGRHADIGRSVPACLCLPFTASAVAPFIWSTSLLIEIPLRTDGDLSGQGLPRGSLSSVTQRRQGMGHGVRRRIRRRHVGSWRAPIVASVIFVIWRNLAPSDRASAYLAHHCAPWHFLRQETAMVVVARPTGWDARRSFGRLYI